MDLNIFTWLLALSPVLIVLLLMMGFKWGGARAGAFAWFAAILVAVLFFGATPRLVETDAFEARCLLHEIDHLDGILFLDRVDSLSRDVFRRKSYG